MPSAAFAPPTVADTKRKFLESFPKPIPGIYDTVIQELLVQQHFIRYSINYAYNPVSVMTVMTAQHSTLNCTRLKKVVDAPCAAVACFGVIMVPCSALT